jgi:2-octaprenyl-6-methoxyphenol hydroxylase
MHDVVIIGGGPVGLSAALAGRRAGLDVLVLEAKAESIGKDPRVFALSYGARLILERLGVWEQVAAACPIRVVHVSQRGHFGRTTLDAKDLGVEALGYVVAYADLVQALRSRIAASGVPIVSGAHVDAVETQADAALVHYEQDRAQRVLGARVVAQADGGANLFREVRSTERDYRQCALTAEVRCERASPDHAYERFTGRGPIALLPLASGHALIWTVPADQAEHLLALPPHEFEAALMQAYGERIGAVRLRGPRASFKLVLRYAHRIASDRHVLIGNAAQTLHPVAGQGFNIGLRDAFELAEALAMHRSADADLLAGLKRYRASRRFDRAGGTLFTDVLVRGFSNDDPLLARGRGLGLFLLDASGAPKRFLMRRMIFGSPG